MSGVSLRKALAIFVQSMKSIYQYIGIVMVYSALWFFVGLGPILLATALGQQYLSAGWVLILLIGTVFTAGPAAAAVYANTAKIIAGEEIVVRDFFVEFRSLYGKSLALTLVNGFVFLVLVADLYFAVNNPNRIVQLLSGLWIYFLVFWMLMNNWMLPLLAHQRTGPIKIVKRAALLTVDNLVVTVIIGLIVILLTAISVVLAAPILIFFMGSISFVHNYAFVETMKKYDSPEADDEQEPSEEQEEN